VKISTAGKMGATKQNAIIYSNDPDQPTVSVKLGGVIKPYVTVKPSPRVIFSGYHGDKLEESLTITANTDEPLAITGVSSTINDKIEYELKNEKKDKEYRLLIKTRGGLEETFRGKIVLKTTSSKKPEIPVTVMANLKKKVQATPEYLYFGVIDTAKGTLDASGLKRTSVITQQQPGDFSVGKIETSKEFVSAVASADLPGKQYTITISLNKDKLPKGKFRETVSVQTQSQGKTDTATIIVEGKVM
jgi:hypothetical protein